MGKAAAVRGILRDNMLTCLSVPILNFRCATVTCSFYLKKKNKPEGANKHAEPPVINLTLSSPRTWGCRSLLNSLCYFLSPRGQRGSRSRCVKRTLWQHCQSVSSCTRPTQQQKPPFDVPIMCGFTQLLITASRSSSPSHIYNHYHYFLCQKQMHFDCQVPHNIRVSDVCESSGKLN